MLIRQFIPVALAFLALSCAIAQKGGVPIAPIAIILVFGEILIAFQLEDHRLGNYLAELMGAFKSAGHVHGHGHPK